MSGAPDRPALNPERTDLAWRRSVLTAAVTGLLAARAAALSWPGPPAVAAVTVIAAAVGTIAVLGRRRGDALAAEPGHTSPARLWLTAIATLTIATLGLAAVLTG
jgi:hypothetical protein